MRVNPREHNVSMKYMFNANIPTNSIQLRDDEYVKIFIRLNYIDCKLLVSLCIITKKINNNQEYESVTP